MKGVQNIKKISIAGSTGMVGTGIIRYILDNHPSVRIRASCHKSVPVITHKRITYIQGDLKSLDDCRRLVNDCDCVILAAARGGGAGFTTSFPWEHMKENLMMNMQILEAALKESVKRIIFIGSATLYPDSECKIKEFELDLNTDPHEAYFGYGWAMRFLEKSCLFLHERFKREVIIVRSANIFGPYAKFDPEVSNFIPAIIRKAVDKMDPFEVWGSPDVQRDVLYVDDFAKAIMMLADNTEITFDVFNIGSDVKTAVRDVVEWALKYANHAPSRIRYSEKKPTTIKSRALDCTKIKRVTGWRPRYSVEDGIRLTTDWWLKNKDTWEK
ncbi:MAG: NAD(P)-dependent oxidoreductase [Candidatus Omnitrophota bacterium]